MRWAVEKPFRAPFAAHPQALLASMRAEVKAFDAALALGEITTLERRRILLDFGNVNSGITLPRHRRSA